MVWFASSVLEQSNITAAVPPTAAGDVDAGEDDAMVIDSDDSDDSEDSDEEMDCDGGSGGGGGRGYRSA